MASKANNWIGLPNMIFVQWMLISPPRHPFLKNAIMIAQSNIGSWIDDKEAALFPMHVKAWWITGPMVWTRAVSTALTMNAQVPFQIAGIRYNGNAIQWYPTSTVRSNHYTNLAPEHPVIRGSAFDYGDAIKWYNSTEMAPAHAANRGNVAEVRLPFDNEPFCSDPTLRNVLVDKSVRLPALERSSQIGIPCPFLDSWDRYATTH